MRAASVKNSLRLVSCLAVVLGLLSGCIGDATEPKLITSKIFTGLQRNQSFGFDLSVDQEGILLVRVEAFEADFESEVQNSSGTVLSSAQTRYVRVGPVFHVIGDGNNQGASKLNLLPTAITRNASITVEVFELPLSTRADEIRLNAYKSYELATQTTNDESMELANERVALLAKAASGFREVGDLKNQLWANFLEAQIRYYPLAEYHEVANSMQEAQQQARASNWHLMDILATQFEGQALIERSPEDPMEVVQSNADRAQKLFSLAAIKADRFGYGFEQAWAINARGIGYFNKEEFEESSEHFKQALQVAGELGDSSLKLLIGGNLALSLEGEGEIFQALISLREINEEISLGGATMDLAHSWSELSRLYGRIYLFDEAVESQKKALDLWQSINSAEGVGRSNLSLASSYFAIGNLDAALAALDQAIDKLESAKLHSGLRSVYGLYAKIYRRLGRFEDMERARENQSHYLISDLHIARHSFERSLDSIARYPDNAGLALSYLDKAEDISIRLDDQDLAIRARLQRCLISSPPSRQCLGEDFESVLAAWASQASPYFSLQAKFLFVKNLERSGQIPRARELLDELITEIWVYRNALPGVLGEWFWQSKSEILNFYMKLVFMEYKNSPELPTKSFLAFNKLLETHVEVGEPVPERSASEATNQIRKIRGLVAKLDSGTEQNRLLLRSEIDRLLLAIGEQKRSGNIDFGLNELQSLQSKLPEKSGILTYYLGVENAYVWFVDSRGVVLREIGLSSEISDVIDRVASGIRVIGNDQVFDDLELAGDLLWGHLGLEMPANVYLMVSGLLSGFPFDAIRLDKQFFGQKHGVVHIASLNLLAEKLRPGSTPDDWRKVVLAGEPVTENSFESNLFSVTQELDSLEAMFGDRVVISVRGDDMHLEFFKSDAFVTADLIHIASHARIDLEYPELSRLLASSNNKDAYLTPLDFRKLNIDAKLVVLSACETAGINQYAFSSNLGFVSELIDSGAESVLAALWPVSDSFASKFTQILYSQIIDGQKISDALSNSKRIMMDESRISGDLSWSAFQLYIN